MSNFTIEINGKTYPLKFGFSFMLKMDKKLTRYDDGTGRDEKQGLSYAIAKIFDRDVATLVDVIMTANETEKDKIKKDELIKWIEDDADIDKVFEEIDGFFEQANCTKNEYKYVQKMVGQMAEEEEEE